jgi:hypothetical protein
MESPSAWMAQLPCSFNDCNCEPDELYTKFLEIGESGSCMCVCRRTPASDDEEGNGGESSTPFVSGSITTASPSQPACPKDPLEHFGVAVDQRRENSVYTVAEYNDVNSVDYCAWLCIALRSSLCLGFGFSTSQGLGTCRLSSAQLESQLRLGTEVSSFYFRTLFCYVGDNLTAFDARNSTTSPKVPDFDFKNDTAFLIASGGNSADHGGSATLRERFTLITVGCSVLGLGAIVLSVVYVARHGRREDSDRNELESNYSAATNQSHLHGITKYPVYSLRKPQTHPLLYSAVGVPDTRSKSTQEKSTILHGLGRLPPGLRNAGHDDAPAWDYASTLSPPPFRRQSTSQPPFVHMGGGVILKPLVDRAFDPMPVSREHEAMEHTATSHTGTTPNPQGDGVVFTSDRRSQLYTGRQSSTRAPNYAEISSRTSDGITHNGSIRRSGRVTSGRIHSSVSHDRSRSQRNHPAVLQQHHPKRSASMPDRATPYRWIEPSYTSTSSQERVNLSHEHQSSDT